MRVVVLNWNSWWFTRRCLRALALTEHPVERLEVVVVDNASVDGSLERLRHEFPGVRVIHNEANLGFAEGCNRAMRDLGGVDMVALVNNDAVVEPGWLAPLVDALERHPDAGAAAARLVLEPTFCAWSLHVDGGSLRVDAVRVDGADATTRTRYGGTARSEGRTDWPMELVHHLDPGAAQLLVPTGPGAHRVEVALSGNGRVRVDGATVEVRGTASLRLAVAADAPRVELLNGLGTERNDVAESYDRAFGEPNDPAVVGDLTAEVVPVAGFSGGGVLLRASMLGEVGLFDPRFFAYYEDSDLSWRAARSGWRTVAVPASVIRHAFGGSGGSRAPGFFFLNYRNWLLTVLRNAAPAQRRAALASARERVRWALRANVASPLKHRRAPRWDLVVAWSRTLLGVVAVRMVTRRARRRGELPGAVPTGRVHSALQPVFAPRSPSLRPGGPPLVLVDLADEPARGAGAAAALLRSLADADGGLDVVPVVGVAGGFRRAAPAEVGAVMGVAGPHHRPSPESLALPAPSEGQLVVRGGAGTRELTPVHGASLIGSAPIGPDAAVLASRLAASRGGETPE